LRGGDGVHGYLNHRQSAAIDETRREELAASFQQIETEAIAGVNDRAMVEAIQLETRSILKGGQRIARNHYRNERVANHTAISQARVSRALDDALQDPTDVAIQRQALGVIDAEMTQQGELNGWAPEVMAEKRGGARSGFASSMIDSLISTDLGSARKLRKMYDEILDGRDKRKMDGKIRREGERLAAEAKRAQAAAAREYLGGLKDTLTFLRRGNDLPEGSDFEYGKLRSMLGDERAKVAWDEIQKAQTFGEHVKLAQDTPDGWRTARDERLAAITDDDPEGIAEQTRELEQLERVRRDFVDALVKDPVNTTLQTSDTLRQLQSDMLAAEPGTDAAFNATKTFTNALLAEQERLGVPPELRRILGADLAKQKAIDLMNAPEGQKGAAVSVFLSQFDEETEARARRELQSAGLDSTTALLADYRDDALALARIETASMIDEKAVKARLETTDGRDMNQALLTEFADFNDAILIGGGAGAINSINDRMAAARRIGVMEMGRGATPEKAAEIAAQTLIGQFDIVDGSNINGVIAKDLGVSVGEIEDYAQDLLSDEALERWDPEPSDADKVDRFSAYRNRRVLQTGYWVYVNDGAFEGFELHKDADGISMPA
ncbi:MAG: hypothetical protein AAFR16_11600, partial [Pseudomonadota bacterium]